MSNQEAAEKFSEAERAADQYNGYVSVKNSLSGKEGGEVLANYLETNPDIRFLVISDCPLGDEGMKALMPAVARHTNLAGLHLHDAGLSSAGADQFFKKFNNIPALCELGISEPEGSEANAAIRRNLSTLSSPNLVHVAAYSLDLIDNTGRRGEEIPAETAELITRNIAGCEKVIHNLLNKDVKELDAQQLRAFDARKSAIFHEENRWINLLEDMHIANDIDDLEDFAQSRRHFAKKDFENLLEALPGMPDLSTPGNLFAPAKDGPAEGFAPLDNPCLWEGKTIDDFKAIPLNRELLEQRTPKGSGLLDSAFAALPAEPLLEHLNRQGVRLQTKALLRDDGTPTEVFDRLIDDGKAAALFTKENWQGAETGELRRAYEALPQAQREQVGYQTLTLSLQKSSPGLGR